MASSDRDREQWHRQLLAREEEVTAEQAVELCAGIYSTAPTSYLSCVARIPSFQAGDLDRALYQDRSLVRMAALRGSGFLIPVDRIDMVVAARDRKEWYGGAVDKIVGEEKRLEWTERLLELLDGEILKAREIRAAFGVSGRESEALRYLLSSLSQERRVVAASGPTSWRDNQYGYTLWDQWLPDHPVATADPEEARAAIAGWYLEGHGPASVDDFSWWSGLKKANAERALRDSGVEIGGGMFDAPGHQPAPAPDGLRLLPIWDTALVTQKSRRRMVSEDHYEFVYDPSGNVTSTVVLDGAVIGVWDRGGDTTMLEVKVAFFAEGGPLDLVEEEASRIASAVGAEEVAVMVVPVVVNLHQSSRNRFMSPLSG